MVKFYFELYLKQNQALNSLCSNSKRMSQGNQEEEEYKQINSDGEAYGNTASSIEMDGQILEEIFNGPANAESLEVVEVLSPTSNPYKKQMMDNSGDVSRPFNSTMMQSNSLNNSTSIGGGTISNSKYGGKKQVHLSIRPQSAIMNVTPALAYKRVKQQNAQHQLSNKIGYHAIRGSKTPAKNQTPSHQLKGLSGNKMKTKDVVPFNQSFDRNLGPGSYDPNHDYVKEVSGSFTIANKKTDTRQSKQSKSYVQLADQKSSKSKKNDQTFGVRTLSHYPNQSAVHLGPGLYEPQIILTKPRSPSALINGDEDDTGPRDYSELGPGHYADINSFGNDALKISIHERLREQQNNRNPGPGHYNPSFTHVQESIHNTRISPVRSQDRCDNDLNPGPGSYDFSFKNLGVDCPTYSINANSKRNLHSHSKTPGPGNYNPKIASVRQKSPEYTISGSAKGAHRKTQSGYGSNLGPGFYSHKSFMGKEGPVYSIKPIKEAKRKDSALGPGYYNPNDVVIKDKVKAFRITQTEKKGRKKVSDGPAPGTFNLNKSIGVEAPKYSIGVRSKSRQELSPGPGHYEGRQANKFKNIAYKIGQSGRLSSVKQSTSPAPNFYQTIDHFGKNAPKVSILSKPKAKPVNNAPGPGYYQFKTLLTQSATRTHAMGKSNRSEIVSKDRKSVPGPGYYESPERFGKEGPKVSLHEKFGDNSRNHYPGPAHYNPTEVLIRERSPQHAIGGSSERINIVSNDRKQLPGPGNYELKTTIGADGQPKYSIGLKQSSRNDTMVPGPGHYDPSVTIVRKSSPMKSFSKSDRSTIVPKEQRMMPGPGVYDVKDQRYANISYKLNIGERMSPMNRDVKMNPGPWRYASPNQFGDDGVRYSIGMRSPSKSYDKLPGPGHYDPKSSLIRKRSPLSKIHPARKEATTDRLSPGPGHYDPNSKVVQSKSPEYRYMGGNADRPQIVSKERLDQPGPGHYSVNTLIGKDSAKYTVGQKHQSRNDNMVPGPGQYQPKDTIIRLSSPIKSFSKTQRQLEVPKEQRMMPGPGVYDPKENKYSNISYKLSVGDRMSPMSRDARLNPGPGNYSSPKKFGDDAVHFSIGQRHSSGTYEQYPGPGYYDANDQLTEVRAPTAKINPVPSPNNQSRYAPGPGHYDPNDAPARQKSPSYKIDGSSNRLEVVSKDQLQNPGPGHYQNRSSIGGDGSTKFTIGERISSSDRNFVPAPGQYDPNDAYVRESQPGLSFSKSERGTVVSQSQQDQLGPGVYDPSDQKFQNVSFKFAQGDRPDQVSRDAKINLGPGNYSSPDKFGDDGVHFSIGKKSNTRTHDQYPGPGYYEAIATLTQLRSPLAKINPIGSPSVEPYTPGPGHYDPIDKIAREQSPSYKIDGTSNRLDVVSKDSLLLPGPGHYSQRDLIGGDGSTKFTIGERIAQSIVNNYPAPGSYDPKDAITRQSSPGKTFAQSERCDILSGDKQLGPGVYDPNDQRFANITYKFAIGDRPDAVSRDARVNPGPGSYQISPSIGTDVPKYTIGQRHQQFTHDQFPGPGYYDAKDGITEMRSPLAKINPLESSPRTLDRYVPGPGHYNPNDGIARQSSPSYKIDGTSERLAVVSQEAMRAPGPGHYPHQDMMGVDSLQYTIGRKIVQNMGNAVPGPGHYDADDAITRQRVLSPSMVQGERGLNLQDDNLGPGIYDPNDQRYTNITYKFSQLERPNTVSRDARSNPGPGHYRSPSKLGDGAVSYTIGARSPYNLHEEYPGPGSYNPLLYADSNGIFINPVHTNGGYIPYTPGPGHYDPDLSAVKERSPEPKIAKSKRDFLTVSRSELALGPGHYNQPQNDKAITYTIGEKLPEGPGNNNPGPGSYTASHTITETRAPKHDFSKSPEREFTRNESPLGPGSYDGKDLFLSGHTSLSYSVPKGDREQTIGDNPGPGQYYIPVKFGEQRLYQNPVQNEEFKWV